MIVRVFLFLFVCLCLRVRVLVRLRENRQRCEEAGKHRRLNDCVRLSLSSHYFLSSVLLASRGIVSLAHPGYAVVRGREGRNAKERKERLTRRSVLWFYLCTFSWSCRCLSLYFFLEPSLCSVDTCGGVMGVLVCQFVPRRRSLRLMPD